MSSTDFDWISHNGMTSDEYQSYFDQYVGEGYRLVWVDGYDLDGQARYAAIWYKNPGPAFVAHHGMSSSQYQEYFDKYIGEGFRLVNVSGYSLGGHAAYAAIWEKGSGPAFVARNGLTAQEFQEAFDKYVGEGYSLTQISGYNVGGTDYYAAIWENPGPTFVALNGMSSSQYQENFDKYVGEGYRLVDVSGYSLDGQAVYAAIWDKSSDAIQSRSLRTRSRVMATRSPITSRRTGSSVGLKMKCRIPVPGGKTTISSGRSAWRSPSIHAWGWPSRT